MLLTTSLRTKKLKKELILSKISHTMRREQAPQHRDLSQPIKDLRAHVQFKIDALPELAQRFNLSQEATNGLRSHLQSELDYLGTLPQEATLRDIMENHFAQGAEFRKKLGVE